MTLTVERPAPFIDLVDMLNQDDLPIGARKRGLDVFSIARSQKTGGKSWGYRDESGRCVACSGLLALPDGAYEAWFMCYPEAARSMFAFVKLAQLTLHNAVDDGVTVRAYVVQGHAPGARLARAIGFKAGPVEGGFEIFIWSRG